MCYLLNDVCNYWKLMLDAKAKPRRVTVIELKRKTRSYSVPSVFIKILHTHTHTHTHNVAQLDIYIYTHTHIHICVFICINMRVNIHRWERESDFLVLRKSHSIVESDNFKICRAGWQAGEIALGLLFCLPSQFWPFVEEPVPCSPFSCVIHCQCWNPLVEARFEGGKAFYDCTTGS